MQQGFWPEPFVAGVSLTYDGTLPEHLDLALPVLEAAGLKGTFFAYPPETVLRLSDWKRAAANGHEIGNGFMLRAVDLDGDLPDWPESTYIAELEEAEDLIKGLNPVKSFAFPGVRTEWGATGIPVVSKVVHDTIVRMNEETLRPLLGAYEIVRTPDDGFNEPRNVNHTNLRSYAADSMDAESLCLLAHLGISQASWVVFAFNATREAVFDCGKHKALVEWLADRRDAVLIAPLREIGGTLGNRMPCAPSWNVQ